MSKPMITPAHLGEQSLGQKPPVPFAPDFDDVYHSADGAWEQAKHVFLAGNGLPKRWQSKDCFVILETGFGLGNNFLATWAAWQADPHRCSHLYFVSIEKHPLTKEDLGRVHCQTANAKHQTLIDQLLQAWPPLTPGIHLLEFDGVTLMLVLGDVQEVMPQLTVSVNAFYLDGFAPAKNPAMWDERWLSRLNRLAAGDATVATWSVASHVCRHLTKAQFLVQKMPGFGQKRHMLQGVFQPKNKHVPLAGGVWPAPENDNKTAFIVGGGLAGCASAWALTQAGWHVTLIERNMHVAMEASGNRGGLFHSIVHASDNVYSRLHRAAALYTAAVVRPWLKQGMVEGQCEGLLRLTSHLSDSNAQALLNAFPWLLQHVVWQTQISAQLLSKVSAPSGGWFFLQGGWLNPADYARAFLQVAQQSGKLSQILTEPVAALSRCSESGQWQALNRQGTCLAQAGSAVLCNAHQAEQLLRASGLVLANDPPIMQKIRGQISQISLKSPALMGICPPVYPLAGDGYGMQTPDGQLIFGATAQTNDEDNTVRPQDTQSNVAKAIGLGILPKTFFDRACVEDMQGRTAWRASTVDHLPLIGAWPSMAVETQASRHEQLRRVPRFRTEQGGLYVFSGLGSRGISWAALGARLLNHWMSGSPCPVETDLRNALDPARFQIRRDRQSMHQQTV